MQVAAWIVGGLVVVTLVVALLAWGAIKLIASGDR